MAYTLKSISYLGSPRKILLQNENGPCPLIAAANALLLRGVLTLPSICIRNGAASTDDIVNMLAARVLKESPASKIGGDGGDQLLSEYHLDELMSLFPSLQYGMDVNPKFTEGPNGYEYTKNSAAFDLMGVELVHGWLLDPNSTNYEAGNKKIVDIVGSKSYNELAEIVVMGSIASSEVKKLQSQIQEKKSLLEIYSKDEKLDSSVDVHQSNNDKAIGTEDKNMKRCDSNVPDAKKSNEEAPVVSKQSLEAELRQTEEQYEIQSHIALDGSIVNKFLTETGHQLTLFGVYELHKHTQEDSTYVFFRNNHFATLTKANNALYLLVTDLGYANVKEVVWEKIDESSISGDTEYADEYFANVKPRDDIAAALGPSLSPEDRLAQRGQTEADYQLAIELSKNDGNLDEREGALMAAATEASLQAWNQNKTGDMTTHHRTDETCFGEISKEMEHLDLTNADMEMAKQLQADFENDLASRRLAEQLEAEERQRITATNSRNTSNAHQANPHRPNPASDAGCILS